jgi:hypothetical protein
MADGEFMRNLCGRIHCAFRCQVGAIFGEFESKAAYVELYLFIKLGPIASFLVHDGL